MRLIDADELNEYIGRESLDTREKIFALVDRMPTLPNPCGKPCAFERPQGTCKTCKYYAPFREQFSNRQRGDGYCKSTITNAEGKAYINCHDEWYCANYEREGEANE